MTADCRRGISEAVALQTFDENSCGPDAGGTRHLRGARWRIGQVLYSRVIAEEEEDKPNVGGQGKLGVVASRTLHKRVRR